MNRSSSSESTRRLSHFHISQRGSPNSSQIILKNNLPFARNQSAWFMGLVSVLVTASTFGFAWNSSAPHAQFRLIWENPQYTIFTINLLSHVTVLFLESLVSVACDNLRWSLCSRSIGMTLLDFIALAGSTSPLGLTQLLFARSAGETTVTGFAERLRNISYRHWSAQRYKHSQK